ncbi:MAG: hypothetical protein AB7T07_06195 [Steroidobacteraceae bacterium]
MPETHKNYIKRETIIGIFANLLMVTAITFVVFGDLKLIGPWGSKGFVADFGIQTFAIGLIASFFPSIITRKRLAAGSLTYANTVWFRLPQNLLLRCLLIACATFIVVAPISVGIVLLIWPSMSFGLFFGLKALLATVTCILVTPVALSAVLYKAQN